MHLSSKNLTIGYPDLVVQEALSFSVNGGELVCVLGKNGCGKSTLFRTLAGLQKPLQGVSYIDGKDVFLLSNNERAKLFSLVLTDKVELENMKVHEVVALGRYPHSSWLGSLSKADKKAVYAALEQVHMEQKFDRFFSQLSDGEKQRVLIAKALAQDTPLILLDEPTAHLDLPNRIEVMMLLQRLAHQTGKAILLSTHELDLALQAADTIWLMRPNAGIVCGIPEDLVLDGSFQETFKSHSFFFNQANGNFSMSYACHKPIDITGESMYVYWTVRALARLGYCAQSSAEKKVKVTAEGWEYDSSVYPNIAALIKAVEAN